jgi:uncharacterized RDD family membrane protein YckC
LKRKSYTVKIMDIVSQKLSQPRIYSTGLKRIWAAVVDYIVFMPLLLIERSVNSISIQVVVEWTFTFLPIAYSIFCHYKFGQTIGKWANGVKVIDVTEKHTLSLKQAFARDIVPLAALLITALIEIVSSSEYMDLEHVDIFIFFWAIAELVTMFLNKKRRAIHDFLAGSVVVRVS